jgi:ornithine decarboxylase
MKNVATALLRQYGAYESFYIANLQTLQHKIDEWKTLLPNVKPLYAMKCNPDIEILKAMVNAGFGFDCASKREIELALSVGAQPNEIGFFHPVKSPRDLLYAFNRNVMYTSFDNLSELDKIHRTTPSLKCLLRLKIDNPTARVQLGKKYGARVDEYEELIDYAHGLQLDIVGTTFHVGSASKDPKVFEEGIKYSRSVFDYVKKKGYLNCNILDIGGGFTNDNFKACAQQINLSVQEHFGDLPNVAIIAEPGRYFAEQVYTFFVAVMGMRKRDNIVQYWVKDGLYGSFNAIMYDQQVPEFEVYRNPFLPETCEDEVCESEIMFETCDSCDKMEQTLMLPKLRVGDYLMVRNFGAYTLSAATDFNGINMTKPQMFYVKDDHDCTFDCFLEQEKFYS